MEYAAVAIAILGVVIGATFRVRFLLGIVLLLLPVCLIFSVSHGYAFLATVLMIVVPQGILQGGYFLGLLGRTAFAVTQRKLTGLSKTQTEQVRRRHDR
jgi:heme O synthase-like polyprenyltransferase